MTISFLLGITLWGVQSKIEIATATIVFMSFAAHRYRLKKPVAESVYNQAMNLVWIALVTYIAWLYNSDQDSNPIYILLRDIPFFMMPLFWLQLLDKRQSSPIGRKSLSSAGERRYGIDVRILTILATLLSSGYLSTDRYTLYLIWCLSLLFLLLSGRRIYLKRSVLCVILFAIAAGLGVFAFRGIQTLSDKVSDLAVDLLNDLVKDPFKVETSIGEIGRLKLEDKILFRVQSADAPLLLMEGNFESANGKSWTTANRSFQTGFQQKKPSENSKSLGFYSDIESVAILPMPLGVEHITGIEPDKLMVSPNQVVKYMDKPGHTHFTVRYTGSMDTEVTAKDYQVPKQHKEWLEKIDKKLSHGTPEQIMNGIVDYFTREKYTYSLDLGRMNNASDAMTDFMLSRKSGHCEYYAAATTLMLRHLGVPARLAVGYSVHEWDESQRLYVVRQRHAHAWTIAYIDGHWVNVDNTPSDWLDSENKEHSPLTFFSDLYSSLMFYWHFDGEHMNQKTITTIGFVILLVLLAIRFFQGIAVGKAQKDERMEFRHHALKRLDRNLANTELKRLNNETLERWCSRVGLSQSLANLYYEFRFGPEKRRITNGIFIEKEVNHLMKAHKSKKGA